MLRALPELETFPMGGRRMKRMDEMPTWAKLVIAILELAGTLAIVLGAWWLLDCAGLAEDAGREVWVICGKDSYVNIRKGPGKNYEELGYAEAGYRLWTDGKEKNGWLHLVGLRLEAEEGWIFAGYVTGEEPEEIGREMMINANGRVACRRWIGGKRQRWARFGDIVTVYWMNGEWAATSRGYIQSKYLRED